MNEFNSPEFRDAFRKAAANMQASIDKIRAYFKLAQGQRTPEEIEAGSRLRYELAVTRERERGLKFVKQCALDARKELGL